MAESASASPTARITSTRSDWFAAVLRYDLPASLVVFLVALPLSLGIAIASDAPASIKRNAEVRKAYLGDELDDAHGEAHSSHGAPA